jgi:hypothetical protein
VWPPPAKKNLIKTNLRFVPLFVVSKFVRQSKVRHIFAQEPKPEQTYQNFKLSTATGDHNYIKGNAKYFGVPISSGGGALTVCSYEDLGKQGAQPPCLDGHKVCCFLSLPTTFFIHCYFTSTTNPLFIIIIVCC